MTSCWRKKKDHISAYKIENKMEGNTKLEVSIQKMS